MTDRTENVENPYQDGYTFVRATVEDGVVTADLRNEDGVVRVDAERYSPLHLVAETKSFDGAKAHVEIGVKSNPALRAIRDRCNEILEMREEVDQ